jgi:hypothetical protein
MEGVESISQLALNLRWLMSREDKRPEAWDLLLTGKTRNTINRSDAGALLMNGPVDSYQLSVLSEMLGYESEELMSVPLYTRDKSILAQNLRYLVETIPHGHGKEAAAKIGVKEAQLSRWKKWGDQRAPHAPNLRKLLKFHGMDPDIDLEVVPIFLSMEPLSGYAQKEWVAARVHDMPAEYVAEIYPALKRLFQYDEEN